MFRNRCRKAAEVKVTRPVKPEVNQLPGKDRVSRVVWHGCFDLPHFSCFARSLMSNVCAVEPFPIRLMAIDIKREVEAGVDRQK